MSRRALRRLRGEQRGQEPLGPDALQFALLDDDDAEEEGPKQGLGGRRPGGAGKEGVRVNNRFELVRSWATRGDRCGRHDVMRRGIKLSLDCRRVGGVKGLRCIGEGGS